MAGDISVIAAAGLVIFFAALLSSIGGFAFSALASAALLRIFEDPVRTVWVIVACSIAIQAYSVFALRHSVHWRALAPFVTGGVFTVPVGVWLLARIPAALFAAGLGLFLVCYGTYLLLRGEPPQVKSTWLADAAVGALGGLCGGLVGFPGAPVTIWCAMRSWRKEVQRALYQPYILCMQCEALLLMHSWAPGERDTNAATLYASIALLAAFAGLGIFRRLTARQFNVTIYALLIASGVSLLGGLL